MKISALSKVCAVLSVVLGASPLWATVYPERDETNRRFTLPVGARVEVSGINGSVDIKAIDGHTAIIEIERSARSRAELDCNRVVVEQALGHVVIKSETVGCQKIVVQVRHRVLLSVPRTVDLSIHGVSGPLNIGEIEGALRISGNSGTIELTQPGRRSIISGNQGTTTIKIRQLDPRGLELSGNSGAIKLNIADGSNIDVNVSRLSGTISSELPSVKVIKTGDSDYYARIGSGGPPIYVEGSSGSIVLGRLEEE